MSRGTELARLRRELEALAQSPESEEGGVWGAPINPNDMTKLRCFIKGPTDTPFQGGIFEVAIVVPSEYPFRPPSCKFATRLWHPNVSSQTGAICLDILKDNWSPALTLKTTLLSLQALLSAPEPKDPQDAQVAAQYLKDYRGWCATAKFWTETYAMPKPPVAVAESPSASAGGRAGGGATAAGGSSGGGGGGGPYEEGVAQLVAMGFGRDAAVRALRAKGGSLELAIEALFAGK